MEDAERWKGIALYLADCHAATAGSLPKATSKSARARFVNICDKALQMLEGKEMPPRSGVRYDTVESVSERLRGVIERYDAVSTVKEKS
jgi:hypothetical protein